ncbi:MAG: TIGR00725 family protein [bacterium]
MARPVVGVMGGADAAPETLALAEALGAAIAAAGWILLNGGRDAGVMAASARGAARAGGLVVGVLPGRDRRGASPDLSVAIVTGLGDARNAVNVLSSDVVVALPGGAGTLSEIALALKAGRPVVALGWQRGSLADFEGIIRAASLAEALDAIRARLLA